MIVLATICHSRPEFSLITKKNKLFAKALWADLNVIELR